MNTSFKIILIIAGIVLVNFLSSWVFHRFDLTEDKQFTLSKATGDILSSMEEPVEVIAYFSDGLPPQIDQVRTELKDLLVEYSSLSGGNLTYQFIDPSTPELQQQAAQEGVTPRQIQMRQQNEYKSQSVFLGAVLKKGEEKDVIPVIQPGVAMEFELSTKIKKLTNTSKEFIGLVQGNGEASPQQLIEVYQNLSIMYNVEPITLTAPIDPKYKTIMLVAPKDSFPPSHFQVLDDFMANGGHLLAAINRVDADLQQASGFEVKTGLENWLLKNGIEVENRFVADNNCGAITVQQQGGGFFSMNRQVKLPFLPIISKFSDHPISKGLEGVLLQFASPITFTGDAEKTFTPIVFSSEYSATFPTPTFIDINKKWTRNDYQVSNLTLGAVVEGNFGGTIPGKIVIIGDGDFATNPNERQRVNPDNLNLMVNAVDFLSDDTGLIDLRTKGGNYRPIDQMEVSSQNMIKYLNFFLPIVLALIYGFIRSQIKRGKRKKRMQLNYEA